MRRWAARTFSVSVLTIMLGLTGMQHEATRERAPSTSTTQTRQAPTLVVPA